MYLTTHVPISIHTPIYATTNYPPTYCLFTHLSIYLHNYISTYLAMHQPTSLPTYVSTYLPTCVATHIPTYPANYQTTLPPTHQTTNLPIPQLPSPHPPSPTFSLLSGRVGRSDIRFQNMIQFSKDPTRINSCDVMCSIVPYHKISEETSDTHVLVLYVRPQV